MSQSDCSQLDELIERGERLLAAGQARAAQKCALEALALRPGNSEAKNLMGLSYYHGGAFGLACDIFDGLARQAGDSVAVRINAGVAALRCQRTALALLHLRRAVDLDPTQRGAYVYLSILHLQGGDVQFASAALHEAQLGALAERALDESEDVEQLERDIWAAVESIAASPAERANSAAGRFAQVDQPPREIGQLEAQGATRRDRAQGFDPKPAVARQSEPAGQRPAAPSEKLRRRRGLPLGRETGLVSDRATARVDSLVPAVAVGPDLEHRDQRVYLRWGAWRSESHSRRPLVLRKDLLLLAQGTLDFAVARRRDRGGDAGPFGVEGRAMAIVDGEGVAVLQCTSGHAFAAVSLLEQGDCLCVRENNLAAFSTQFHWDNGAMPDGVPMVRLAGQGTAMLVRSGELGRAWIDEGTPAIVRADALLGWLGDVVVTQSATEPDSDGAFYRCEGEGTVLVETGVVP